MHVFTYVYSVYIHVCIHVYILYTYVQCTHMYTYTVCVYMYVRTYMYLGIKFINNIHVYTYTIDSYCTCISVHFAGKKKLKITVNFKKIQLFKHTYVTHTHTHTHTLTTHHFYKWRFPWQQTPPTDGTERSRESVKNPPGMERSPKHR